MRGLRAEEQIIALRTDLLRIHSRVLRLTTALENLSDTINDDDAAPSSSTTSTAARADSTRREGANFQQNVLLDAQRRVARRTLTQAVRAGALIPRNALDFIVEGYSSSDEDLDIFSLRRAPESGDESEVPTVAPTRTTTAVNTPANLRTSPQPRPVRAAWQATAAPTVPTSAVSDFTAASVRNPRCAASPRAAPQQRKKRQVSAGLELARAQAEAWSTARQRSREERRKKDPSKEKPVRKR